MGGVLDEGSSPVAPAFARCTNQRWVSAKNIHGDVGAQRQAYEQTDVV
jgi:hypothetical protein